MMQKFIPEKEEKAVLNYIDQLQHKKIDGIESNLDDSIKSAEAHEELLKLASFIPSEKPQSIKTVGAYVNHFDGISTTNLTLEYSFKKRWILINFVTQNCIVKSRH